MKVLLLTEKYCDMNPGLGLSSSHLFGSLTCSKLAEVTPLYYDELNRTDIDDYIITDVIQRNPPDAVVCSYYPHHSAVKPTGRTFDYLRGMTVDIPLYLMWFDFAHEGINKLAWSMSGYGTNIVLDVVAPPPFVSLWSPQDQNIMNNPGKERTTNACFLGTVGSYNFRREYLNYAHSQVTLLQHGGQREGRLTMEEYAEILKTSKISINFSDKPGGHPQLKGRVFESMLCGAMLLEQENNEIKRFYTPFIHYVPFTTKQDMVEKIKYYSLYHHERERIAAAGQKKTEEDYSCVKFWEKVLLPQR